MNGRVRGVAGARQWRAFVAILLVLTFGATAVAIGVGQHGVGYSLLYAAIAGVYLLVGLVVVERRQGTRVGRAIVGFGGAIAMYAATDAYVRLPGPPAGSAVLAWLVTTSDGPLFLLVTALFLNFPTERLPSRRWRLVAGLSAAQAAWLVTGSGFRPGPFPFYPEIDNPFGIAGFPTTATFEIVYMLQVGLVGLSALSLVGRWRSGTRVERAQLKWAAAAAAVLVTAMMGYGIAAGPTKYSDAGDIAVGIGFGLFPVAIGIAILRYRLYEIDRLISRTLAYGALTGILVAVFGAGVLAVQAVLSPFTAGGGPLAVATSTLAAFALFQLLRRRIQDRMDRRFNRSRYDAQQAVAALAARLRDQIDLGTVSAELAGAASEALSPQRVGIWIRSAAGQGR